jgi:hypothetical protein
MGAPDHPTKWHNIGKLDAPEKAARVLAKSGVIEFWWETNMYRLKQTKSILILRIQVIALGDRARFRDSRLRDYCAQNSYRASLRARQPTG